MIDAKLQGASAMLASVTAVAGFAAPWPVVVVGFCFALTGGFGAMAVMPPQQDERLGILPTALVALVIGGIFGLAHPIFLELAHRWVEADLPLPLIMAIGGAGSRPLLKWFAGGGWTALFDRFTGRAQR